MQSELENQSEPEAPWNGWSGLVYNIAAEVAGVVSSSAVGAASAVTSGALFVGVKSGLLSDANKDKDMAYREFMGDSEKKSERVLPGVAGKVSNLAVSAVQDISETSAYLATEIVGPAAYSSSRAFVVQGSKVVARVQSSRGEARDEARDDAYKSLNDEKSFDL